ncbi:hypothetical protein [Kocuria rosea]|uniref:hypothetical protein n=1 Tax=Kocuria rosea TaxID=1275 RepID=UPI00254228ED|nr:hypothetical protein [Kocuria rosea]WIG18398.1 hypothetical protein QOY29_05570 [Kocuria rosea]
MTDTASGGTIESFIFGDHLDWSSETVDVTLSVELPFWLMMEDCDLQLSISGVSTQVSLRDSYVELYAGEVLDSRRTLAWQGPDNEDPLLATDVIETLEEHGPALRPCRSVVKIAARAHSDVFTAFAEQGDETAIPGRANEAKIYLASLCDAHIPVLNDLIQRYRLASYDYHPYEVAPWDVPVWLVAAPAGTATVRLLPYSEWDRKPVIHDQHKTGDPDAGATSFRFTDPATVSATDPVQTTPGEFELLDARSMMERGDYTGSVRRSVTAIEAVVEHALSSELAKTLSSDEVRRELKRTETNFPRRFEKWQELSGVKINSQMDATFSATRKIRHQIVHRALRLTHADRGTAQMSVDNARWLFNAIEGKPDRTALREKPFVLRDMGRVATFARFDVIADEIGIRVQRPSQ